jgi:hypothetical protein
MGVPLLNMLVSVEILLQASSESSSLDIADETPFFGRLGNYTEGGEKTCDLHACCQAT